MRIIRSVICILSAVLICGCSETQSIPDLSSIYNRAAQTEDLGRNPVIIIPGILGSRLKDPTTNSLAWGAFGGDSIDPETPEGMRAISLPMELGVPLSQLQDEIVPDGVLSRLRITLLGLPVELSAYRNILQTLGAGGYRDQSLAMSGEIDYGKDHFTCFQYGYDWRRDISENAKVLDQFIQAKRAYVQGKLKERFNVKDPHVKFDLVAHSMGGLLARYYLMYGAEPLPEDGSMPPLTWAGTKNIDRLIVIGTPNAGSVQALKELVEGVQFSPVVPKYEAAVLGTMPSVYELLPRPRHGSVVEASNNMEAVNIYDSNVWIKKGWGLADPAQDDVLQALLPDVKDITKRREIALDHLNKSLKKAEQFSKSMDREVKAIPEHVSIYLIAGDAEPTTSVVGVQPMGSLISVIKQAPGDGTVLRSSALLDERVGATWTRNVKSPIPWQNVTFLFRDHLALTQDPAFTDNILYLLLEQPR